MSCNTCNPYLFFNRNAAEAIAFYGKALDAKVEVSACGKSPINVDNEKE